MANPARVTASPAHLDGLTDGVAYQVRGRSYYLINPGLGDVAGNRIYSNWNTFSGGPWSPLASSTYATTVTADSPTAYFKQDETSGTSAADAAGGAAGTYVGAPTLAQPGLINARTSVHYAAGKYLTVASRAGVKPFPFFGEVWFQADTLTGDQTIFRKDGDYFAKINPGGTLQFGVWNSAGALSNGSTSAVIVAGQKYMLQVAWAGSQLIAYLGDVTANTITQVFSGGASGTGFGTGTSPLELASYGAGANEVFTGYLDELAFYNVVLTPTQRQAHFNAGTGSSSAPPAILWDSKYAGGGGGYLDTGLVSDSSPAAHESSISIVNDPLGVQLAGVTRKVARIDSNNTLLDQTNARVQAGSPNVITPDSSTLYYIGGGYMFPNGSISGSGVMQPIASPAGGGGAGFSDWGDVHGPPYSGSPVLEWSLTGGPTPGFDGVDRTVSGRFHLRDGFTSQVFWVGPDIYANPNLWIDVVVEFLYKTTATGTVRVWMNTTGTWVLQTLTNNTTQISGVITCGPGDSQGDGYFKIAHYWDARSTSATFLGTTTSYFAEQKIGTTFASVQAHSHG